MYQFLLELSPNQDIQYIINIVLVGLIILQAVVIVVLSKNLNKIKNRLFSFMPEDLSQNVEELLIKNNENVKRALEAEKEMLKNMEHYSKSLNEEMQALKFDLETTNNTVKNCVQKFATVRYNPFSEVGGDFCYAIALLDDHNNGILINSIYAREGSYSYAKEITDGKSSHKLSHDEERALNMALEKKSS